MVHHLPQVSACLGIGGVDQQGTTNRPSVAIKIAEGPRVVTRSPSESSARMTSADYASHLGELASVLAHLVLEAFQSFFLLPPRFLDALKALRQPLS